MRTIALLCIAIATTGCSSNSKASYPESTSRDSTDIVDAAIAAGSFETLVTAVQTAGLVDTLRSEGPFTVFAPTDDAFAKLPSGTVENLLQNPEKLKSILTYHVVPGRFTAKDVMSLSAAPTAQGQKVSISVRDGSVFVDQAKVVQADIECSNGVIHVIDSVILPK